MNLLLLARSAACVLVLTAALGCASNPPPEPWESRLQGQAIVLLGEVHDNAEQHRLRHAVLRRALERGWRPVIAMEQFDTDRQPDIDRARRERPTDAQHMIDAAASSRTGWNWDFYRPYVALALEFDLPLVAANLANASTSRIVREGDAAVLGTERVAGLGLTRPIAPDWQAAQEHEIDAGHCGALPARLLGPMSRAQFARDAVMAETVRSRGSRGIVLLAGNGHVRRDLGVPRWLAGTPLLAVGYLEARPDATVSAAAFDAVVRTAPVIRPDPCADFAKMPPMGR